MSAQGSQSHNPIDVSMKMLIRGRPEAALSLAGLVLPPQTLRFEDTDIITHEYRADHVLILENPRLAIYWEYQLVPKLEVVARWAEKCASLMTQLGMPDILIVIYLEKGGYATFHDGFEATLGNTKTLFQFTAIKLWEHADRLRSGELIELVPFLFLCDNESKEETVLEEIDLIYRSDVSRQVQSELYQAVFRVAGSRLPKEVIDRLYREKESMIKENFDYDVLRDILIDEGVEKGIEKGIEKGKLYMVRKLLEGRLGAIPQRLESFLQTATQVQLDELFDNALKVESYDELRLPSTIKETGF